jgi:hypothetical protein
MRSLGIVPEEVAHQLPVEEGRLVEEMGVGLGEVLEELVTVVRLHPHDWERGHHLQLAEEIPSGGRRTGLVRVGEGKAGG